MGARLTGESSIKKYQHAHFTSAEFDDLAIRAV
jgi:hypothetical protein